MLRRLRLQVTYANVTGTLALFIALGGTGAYAVNEWNGTNIQDGTLTGADIQDLSLGLSDYGANSISTGKLKDGDVRTQDLRDLGVTNPKIAWDSVSSGKVINNNLLGDDIRDGEVGKELFSQNIPSGRTVRGRIAGGRAPAGSSASGAASFPARAPGVPSLGFNEAAAGEGADPACTGSFLEPSAPAGKVCVYWEFAYATGGMTSSTTRDGFRISLSDAHASPAFSASWAYTAP
jgi:hypothetical protein